MALHHMVYDCATKTANKVELSAEEEAAELKRWADNDEAQKNQPKVLSDRERIETLEATIKELQGNK
jgi:hypothetical protein